MIFLPIIIFGFGLIIGSFLNVVILRLNTGRSIATGRSACARCSTKLSWYELVPVFSFLGLRGKCKTCQESISFQYPLVELLTGITFVLLYSKYFLGYGFTSASLLAFLFAATVASLLIVILVYDFKHKIIPNKIVYPFIALCVLSVVWKVLSVPGFNGTMALFAGIALAAPFFLLWFFSKGKLMGFGDVKLALGVGMLVGLVGALGVFLLSFWIGAVIGLLLLAATHTHGMKSEIPFAPFMIAGLFLVAIVGFSVESFLPIWN